MQLGPVQEPETEELVCADQGVPGPPDSCQNPPTMQYLYADMFVVCVCDKHVPDDVNAIPLSDEA